MHARDNDNKIRIQMIGDANGKLKLLDDDIKDRLHEIDHLKHKLNSQLDATVHISRDKDGFAIRNSKLNSAILSMQDSLESRKREMAALNVSLADLNGLYHYRLSSNNVLEKDIGYLSHKVNALETHNRGIGHELHHVVDRDAYIYGDHGKAHFYHHKKRDLEEQLKSSKHHVDYVRATSPARSPVRRYY